MKRKKSPVLLIAFLVVLLGTALGINMIQSGVFARGPADGNDARVAPDAPETAAELKERMRGKAGSPVVAVPTEETARRGGGKKAPAEPAVKVDQPQKYVPKPTDTQTGSGWYTEEGRKK